MRQGVPREDTTSFRDRKYKENAVRLNLNHERLVIRIDGYGGVIPTGVRHYEVVPFSGLVTQWHMVGDAVGTIDIDVWKDVFANFPPTIADEVGGNIAMTAAQSRTEFVERTWSAAGRKVVKGDCFGFNVNSVATLKWVVITLWITRT